MRGLNKLICIWQTYTGNKNFTQWHMIYKLEVIVTMYQSTLFLVLHHGMLLYQLVSTFVLWICNLGGQIRRFGSPSNPLKPPSRCREKHSARIPKACEQHNQSGKHTGCVVNLDDDPWRINTDPGVTRLMSMSRCLMMGLRRRVRSIRTDA